MNTRYPHLANGYVGLFSKNATLNSQYHYVLFNGIQDSSINLEKIVMFAQRIPRSGFFEELHSLETESFKKVYDNKVTNLKIKYLEANNIFLNQRSSRSTRLLINWINILSRYGQFEFILQNSQAIKQENVSLELAVSLELTFIELKLSAQQSINVGKLAYLANRYLPLPEIEIREKLLLLNQLIVIYYRYQKKPSLNSITKHVTELYRLMKNFELNDFADLYLAAIIYRGLSMVKEIGVKEQSNLLTKAEDIARTLSGSKEIETIIAADNLYTLLQTKSKWAGINAQSVKAEECLMEMTNIDSNDSIAFSELGFFYMVNKNFSKSAEHFEKAARLGPPGVGMNIYYYAKSLQQLNRIKDAISALYESGQVDPLAVSPWIDLFDYYIEKQEFEGANKIRKHILKHKDLIEQLTNDEIKKIYNFSRA